jgi:HAE1 family hydrophobic/amphiphilic exporter-1
VLLALVVAVTVIPTASARFLKAHNRGRPGSLKERARSLFGLTPVLGKAANGFSNVIYELTSRDKVMVAMRVVIVAAFTFASVGGAWYLMPPTTYLPSGNRNLVFGMMMNPPGYNMNQSLSVAQRVEDDLRPYWSAEKQSGIAEDLPPVVNPTSGEKVTNIPAMDNYFLVTFRGNMFMGATSEDKTNVEPLGGLLSTAMFKIPGSFGFAEQQSIFGRGLGGTNTIEVDMSANDMSELREAANALEGRLIGEFGQRSIRPVPQNYNLPGPELQVAIDRVRAADLGVDTSLIGLGVQSLIDGAIVGDYRYEGESIDLLLKRSEQTRNVNPQQLGQIPFATVSQSGDGKRVVPLSAVAAFQRADSPQSIRRIEQIRTITLEVTPRDMPLETAMGQIRGLIQQGRDQGWIPPRMEVDLAGTANKLSQVREALLGQWHGLSFDSLTSLGGSRMFLALLVTYLLMAALFESFLYPFVIMFSVPLATVGGFIGLAITHYYYPDQQLDTLTMLGFVILIGIVVNNAILIVHQALNFMRGEGDEPGEPAEGMAPREAIRESVRVRIRPIFMTTITSVAGMLPLVVSGPISNAVPWLSSSGSELYRGLGSVVVGGLLVATVFTLVVVPLLFSLALDGRAALLKLTAESGVEPQTAA